MPIDQSIKMIMIGAGKAGTTSTHYYLRQHPNISLPWRKETHFFIADEEAKHPLTSYMGKTFKKPITRWSDYLAEFEPKLEDEVRIEICPSYLLVPTAAENIHRRLPNCVITILLRDPAERFFSDYKFMKMNGELTPEERIFNPEEFERDVESLAAGKANEGINLIFERGRYAHLLDRYKAIFPREAIKIHLYEEIREDPNALMNRLASYVGLPEFEYDTSEKFMTSGTLKNPKVYKLFKGSNFAKKLMRLLPAKTYRTIRAMFEKNQIQERSQMPPSARNQLLELYRGEIVRLQSEFNLNLRGWFE